MSPREGWLERQRANTARSVYEWPEWMRREAGIPEPEKNAINELRAQLTRKEEEIALHVALHRDLRAQVTQAEQRVRALEAMLQEVKVQTHHPDMGRTLGLTLRRMVDVVLTPPPAEEGT